MRAMTIASLLVCALLGVSARPAAADVVQIGCASIERTNTSHQVGLYGTWLEYIVETRTSPNVCTSAMIVAAHVQGVSGTALSSWGILTATASRQVIVPIGPNSTKGVHEVTLWILPYPFSLSAGETVSNVTIVGRGEPPPDPEEGEESCTGNEYYWDGENCIPLNCPIVISLDRGGYRFTSAGEGVPFDLNANGVLEKVAWTARDSEVAFLALDRNGNGRIDSGAELFGNHTPVIAGSAATSANGFEALRFAQGGSPTAADDVINAQDPVFSRLLLWTDRNHNGISEPDELQRLSDSGIAAISLDYKAGRRKDQFGNEFRQRGTIQWADGANENIYDIWLRIQR